MPHGEERRLLMIQNHPPGTPGLSFMQQQPSNFALCATAANLGAANAVTAAAAALTAISGLLCFGVREAMARCLYAASQINLLLQTYQSHPEGKQTREQQASVYVHLIQQCVHITAEAGFIAKWHEARLLHSLSLNFTYAICTQCCIK